MPLPDKAYLAINDDQLLLYMVNLIKGTCNLSTMRGLLATYKLSWTSKSLLLSLPETISASGILEGAVDTVRDDGEVGTGVGNWASDNSEVLENRA